MELATPVDSRTKEPFSMDYQSSVTSSLTYQATFAEQSNLDSSTSSTPKNSPKATIVRDLQSSELESVGYRSGSRPELQYDPTNRSAANLTPATRLNNRERSRSPRPVVSAEARARWAMLASLAGVSKDDNLSEDEEDGQRAPDAATQSSDPFSDPRLRPLHLLDPSGDAASIERYLHNLEKDPHVDNRLLQEGLEASKRLSNDYTKGQQAMSRSRGHSSATEPEANSQGIHQEVRNQQMERKRPAETSANQGSQDRQRTARVERSVAASLPANAQVLEDKNREIGHGVEHGFEDAKVDIEGNVFTTSQKAEALLHTHGDHGIAEGLEKRVHRVEGAVQSIGSELHVPNIGQDIRNGDRNLSLAGKETMRDLREEEHGVDAGFRDTERLIQKKLPGLDIRHDIRRSEHDLKDGLHKLESVDLARDVRKGEHALKDDLHKVEGADLTRDVRRGEQTLKEELHKVEGADLTGDVRRGEHELDAGIRHAEEAVESVLPGGHILQDVEKGEHELKFGIGVAEKAIEGDLNGPNLQRKFRRGEHELEASVNSIVKSAENVLPGKTRDIREAEHNVKSSLLRDAPKVENALAGLDLHQEASEVARDLAKGFYKTADTAERDVRKVDGYGLVKEFEKDGRAVEHNLERLGTSTVGHISKDEHAVGRDARTMGQSAENARKDVGRLADIGVRMGDQAVNQAMKAASDLRPLDNEGPQGRDRAGNKGPASSPKVLPSGTGMGKPATSNCLTNMGEPSRPHSQGIFEEHGKPDERRANQMNDKGLQNNGSDLKNPPQAPYPLMAQHGPVHPPTNPAQLRPSPVPTGLRAPYPTKNEPTRATMPAMPSESNHLSPMGQAPTQRGLSEAFQHLGSNKITPESSQATGPNSNQRAQTLAQSRLAENAQASRPNETNPRLSQPAVPPIRSNSFRPDQQRHSGIQSRNQVFQPSPARPQSNRYQALSTNKPPQPRQPGANPPSISNVKVPTGMPQPRVDAANTEPQHRQEIRGQDKPNVQLSEETPPQQSAKPTQNPQGVRQNNLVPSGQHSEQQEPGTMAKLTTEDQRKAQIQDDGKAAANLVQNSLSQTKASQQKGNPSNLPFHARKYEEEPECEHRVHKANASIQQSQGNSAAKQLSQTTTEVPSPISGPQQMLNMLKARSQTSIHAAGGCPGFVDRKFSSISHWVFPG